MENLRRYAMRSYATIGHVLRFEDFTMFERRANSI